MKPSFLLVLIALIALNFGVLALVTEFSPGLLMDAIIALAIMDFIFYLIYQYQQRKGIGCGTCFIIWAVFIICGNSLNENDISMSGSIILGIVIIAALALIFFRPNKNLSKKESDRIIELAHQQEIIERQQEKEEAEKSLSPSKRAKKQREDNDEDTEEFLRKERERIDKILKMRDSEIAFERKKQIPEIKESTITRCVGVCSDCNRTECLNDKLREERKKQREKDDAWMM